MPLKTPLPWFNWLFSPRAALRAGLCVAWRGGAAAAWQHAVDHRNEGLAQDLLETGVTSVRVDPWSLVRLFPTQRADKPGQREVEDGILECVLEAGFDPNRAADQHVNGTLLHHAVWTVDQVKVGLLLKYGAGVNQLNKKGMTALETGLREFSNWDALGRALYDPAEPLNHGDSAVRGVVLKLIQAGADTTARSTDGLSLLARAPLDFEILKALVEHGCDPKAPLVDPDRSSEGQDNCLLFRALDAEVEGFGIWLSVMQGFGLGPDTVAPDGTTLAMKAVATYQSGNKGCFDAIRAAGFPFTGTDGAGNTVLHVWAERTSTSFGTVGNLLLSMREVAEMASVRNGAGKTAADILEQDRADWVDTSTAWGYVARLRALELGKTLMEVIPDDPDPEPLSAAAPRATRRPRL